MNNNHNSTERKQLDEKLLKHNFIFEDQHSIAYLSAKKIAAGYASLENAVAVLSDMRQNISYICYGRLGQTVGLGESDEEVDSIWEKNILERIHPDDATEKIAQELQFHSFIHQQPTDRRQDYYLQHLLRVKTAKGDYMTLRHRIFYLCYDSSGNVLLSLCLYNAVKDNIGQTGIICSLDDTVVKESNVMMRGLLSARECEVLEQIRRGMASKQIADSLCISVNTVNNHRQNIMHKLHCKNTTEAIDIAQRLGVLL